MVMSGLEALSARPKYKPPVVAPTFWCVTCQMSLITIDERWAHAEIFPVHVVKTVTRLACPICGNDMPLENGFFPDHWVGSTGETRKCHGSRKHA